MLVRGAVAAVVVVLMWAAPVRAQGNGCLGDTSANLPEPKPGAPPLTFGIYPGGSAGAVVGPQAQAKPDDPQKILASLSTLSAGRAFGIHLYLEFTGLPEQEARVAVAEANVDRYTSAGYEVEYVLPYRPAARAGEPDVKAFAEFARAMVRRLGPKLAALQITNEVNNVASPNASDGAYPNARDALVQGVLAADEEARKRKLSHLEIGFNWFYRTDPQTEEGFWRELGEKGGPAFAAAVDWVGLDAYPGTYFPPGPLYSGGVVNGMSSLRCYMALAGLGETVPIHITENGYPTGPGRSPEEQATALRQMVEAVDRFKGNYNVTDHRWFNLRDGDSADPNFQSQYGLMRDDYSPKPAFEVLRELVTKLGAGRPPENVLPRPQRRAAKLRLTLRKGIARVSGKGIRSVTFYGRGCRRSTDRKAPFKARVRCRRGVRARVVLSDGRRTTLRRAATASSPPA